MFGSFSSCRHVRVSWWCCWCKLCTVSFHFFKFCFATSQSRVFDVTVTWPLLGLTLVIEIICAIENCSPSSFRSPVLLQEISPAFNKSPFLTALCLKEIKSCVFCVLPGYKDSKTAERQRTSSCQHVAVRPRRWRRRSFVSAQCACFL